MDLEIAIKAFAKARRVKPEDYEQFKQKILEGLPKLGLPTDQIDIAKYKEVAKHEAGTKEDVPIHPQDRAGKDGANKPDGGGWGEACDFAAFGKAWRLVVKESD